MVETGTESLTAPASIGEALAVLRELHQQFEDGMLYQDYDYTTNLLGRARTALNIITEAVGG